MVARLRRRARSRGSRGPGPRARRSCSSRARQSYELDGNPCRSSNSGSVPGALEDVDPMAAIVVHLALRLPLPCASGQFHLVPATRPAPAAMLLMPCFSFPQRPRRPGRLLGRLQVPRVTRSRQRERCPGACQPSGDDPSTVSGRSARRRRGLAGALPLALVGLVGAVGSPTAGAEPLAAKLADAFRIDVSAVDVTYDFWPTPRASREAATLRFEMRPGQTRPLFDFNPLRRSRESERSMITSLELDGERLDPYDNADLRRIRRRRGRAGFRDRASPQLRRRAHAGSPGRCPSPFRRAPSDWFFTNFDDTEGPKDETETLWPTISSPEDLIHHTIHLHVHSRRRYTVAGSGSGEDASRRRPAFRPGTSTRSGRSRANGVLRGGARGSVPHRSLQGERGGREDRLQSGAA